MALCLGTAGISLADFKEMEISEISAVWNSFREREEVRQRSEWERMRLQTAMILQSLSDKKVDPKKILPFPWDKPDNNEPGLMLSPEERKARFEYYQKNGRWPETAQ